MLPSNDKLSLFRTCKQLARQVLSDASSVQLQFCMDSSGHAVDRGRNILEQLLASARCIKLVVTARGPQPFPAVLGSKVTVVELRYKEKGPASTWLEWCMLTNLQSLILARCVVQADVDSLADALKAGELQQLHSLVSASSEFGSGIDFELAAQGLGPRLKTLLTTSYALLEHVHLFTALETVTFPHVVSLTNLLMHPSLKTVNLVWWESIYGYYSEQQCNWRCICLVGTQNPRILLSLPVAGVQQLCIQRRISSFAGKPGLDAFRFVVDKYMGKVQLLPQWDDFLGKNCFKIRDLSTDTVPIIAGLKTSSWLVVERSRGEDPQGPAFVPAVWASLDPAVPSVRFQNTGCVGWPNFWRGIPTSVQHIELQSPEFYPKTPEHCSATAMCDLVARAPAHVKSLRLFSVDSSQHGIWEAAGFRSSAPAGLKLDISRDWQ